MAYIEGKIRQKGLAKALFLCYTFRVSEKTRGWNRGRCQGPLAKGISRCGSLRKINQMEDES